jgi:hypothetical protein
LSETVEAIDPGQVGGVAAFRVRYPLRCGHWYGRWRWYWLLPVGHYPLFQRP